MQLFSSCIISPLLANLYLPFALDKWLEKRDAEVRFVRYADDMVIHCRSKEEAETLLQEIKERLRSVALRVNEEKTQIVYCKDYRRTEKQSKVQFGFYVSAISQEEAKASITKKVTWHLPQR